MEVECQHLSTNILRGQISLSGVMLRPQLPNDRARLCEITLDRITISSSPFAAFADAPASRIQNRPLPSATVPSIETIELKPGSFVTVLHSQSG